MEAAKEKLPPYPEGKNTFYCPYIKDPYTFRMNGITFRFTGTFKNYPGAENQG